MTRFWIGMSALGAHIIQFGTSSVSGSRRDCLRLWYAIDDACRPARPARKVRRKDGQRDRRPLERELGGPSRKQNKTREDKGEGEESLAEAGGPIRKQQKEGGRAEPDLA